MTTQVEKLKALKEKVGECWHDSSGLPHFKCTKCDVVRGYHNRNPSPTDLNELFRLADKLDYEMDICVWGDFGSVTVRCKETHKNIAFAYDSSLSEALLDALYKSIKE